MLVEISLISDSQIYFNLKRTAAKGLISLLEFPNNSNIKTR